MKYRAPTLLTLLLPVLAAGGAETGFGGARAADTFCRGALAGVEAFMASHEEPACAPGASDGQGKTVVTGSIGEIADMMRTPFE